jgi:hypothetical protein
MELFDLAASRPTTLTEMPDRHGCPVDRLSGCEPRITKPSPSGWVLPLPVATPAIATAAAVKTRAVRTVIVVTPRAGTDSR